ncbi:MAG: hypothetical protein MUC51_17890, partial [Anaerolineae bacterium]|nr:hypothetical protein [Anaerolineae bacterium]
MRRRRRLERAQALAEAQAALEAGCPEREAAAVAGVARSTLRDWRSECSVGAAPAALAAFAKTPEGVEWLHALEIAAHFVITLLAGGGVRLVCRFLELSGLAQIVGASYGAQQKLNAALDVAVLRQTYETAEQARE